MAKLSTATERSPIEYDYAFTTTTAQAEYRARCVGRQFKDLAMKKKPTCRGYLYCTLMLVIRSVSYTAATLLYIAQISQA